MGICCSLPTLYEDVQWVYVVLCLHCMLMFNGHMLFFAYIVCGRSNEYMLFFTYTVCGCSMGICCSLPTLYVDVQGVYVVLCLHFMWMFKGCMLFFAHTV